MVSTKQLFKFLDNRFQALEAIGKASGKTIKTTNNSPSKSSVLTATKSSCPLCKGNHLLFSCSEFLKQVPKERYASLKRLKLCRNCLKPGHSSGKCQTGGCNVCQKKHNTLLHFSSNGTATGKAVGTSLLVHQAEETIKNADCPSAIATVSNPVTLTVNRRRTPKGYVVLNTAIVKLQNHEGKFVTCRALLDSGSQTHYITEELAKFLNLPRRYDPEDFDGIGQVSQRTTQKAHLLIQSRINEYQNRIEACIIRDIASHQPSQRLDISNWNIPKKN